MPRLLRKILTSCDECPLRQPIGGGLQDDHGWHCNHPQGQFRIADEGGWEEQDLHGDSVSSRLGKDFPDRCPLPITEATSSSSSAPRTRAITLPDHG